MQHHHQTHSVQMLQENEQLRTQNAALSSDEPAAEYAALLEAAESENLELQTELQRAHEMNKGLTAALQAAQAAGAQLQAANTELLEQLQGLGIQPRVPSPSQMDMQETVRCAMLHVTANWTLHLPPLLLCYCWIQSAGSWHLSQHMHLLLCFGCFFRAQAKSRINM